MYTTAADFTKHTTAISAATGPLYGYYTRHGEYVPGAGDLLIYGPGYVFVPGTVFLARTATCRRVPARTSTATSVAADRRPDKV